MVRIGCKSIRTRYEPHPWELALPEGDLFYKVKIMSITKLLSSDNFISVNKSLVKIVGLEAAVLLGNLASEYEYWESREELQDGFFFSTVENIEDKTGLTAYQQRQAINKLEGLKIIETRKMGIPAKRYIRISEQQVVQILNHKSLKNLTTGSEKTSPQDVKKFNSNKIINNNIREDKRKKERKKESEVKTQTFDEILDSVPVIRDNIDLRDTFIDFVKMRKLIKKPLTDRALKGIINDTVRYGKGDIQRMIAVLEQSIKGSWQGVYDLKEEYPRQTPRQQKSSAGFVNEFDEILKQEGYE